MATPTYTLLDSVELSSSANSISFTSISQAYEDLVLVSQIKGTSSDDSLPVYRFNGNTGNIYARYTFGTFNNSPSTNSNKNTSLFSANYSDSYPNTNQTQLSILQLMNYAGSGYKTSIGRVGTHVGVEMMFGTWENTSGINSIEMFDLIYNFASGSTFYLYGIGQV